MILYTIGFTQKSAEKFFETLRFKKVQILIDVRLFNSTQLAGFTKKNDLKYFLKTICNCEYEHKVEYAPTKKILDDYKKEKITWNEYEFQYKFLMDARKSVNDFITCFNFYDSVCLLCAEPTPEHCHRRLFAELVKEKLPDVEICHL
ncbi:MAG: DUF488 domain-containing protein [Synergistaceae bacterium]|nr:DUF488 domain-containing protein [Synergistaceae bacterium]